MDNENKVEVQSETEEKKVEYLDEFFDQFQSGNDEYNIEDEEYDLQDEESKNLVLPILAGVLGLAVVSFAGLFVAEKHMGKQLIPGFSLVQGVDVFTSKVVDILPQRKSGLTIEAETTTEAVTEKATEKVTEVATEAVTEKVTEVATEAVTEKVTEVATEAATEVTTEKATKAVTETATEKVTEAKTEKTSEATVAKEKKKKEQESEMQTEMYVQAPEFVEDDVYAFMQGPVAYEELVPYSGEWFDKELAGTVFSDFGCGMCCMANLYSTFTPYTCSPLDMYEYAKETTDYSPGGGSGAIAWQYMQKALGKAGFTTELHKKDEIYRGLIRSMERGWAAVALVSCDDDPSFWKTTPGHYVTIWDYDNETRTVFLTDSGDPSHNRQRIPLQYVYSAFKTADEFQYLLITSYNEEDNTWKHDGIAEKWHNPKDPESMKPDEKESETSKKEE